MTQWGFFLSSLVWRLTVLNGQNVIGPSDGRWQLAEEHFSTEPQGLTEMGDSFCECHIFSSGKWKTEEVSKKKEAHSGNRRERREGERKAETKHIMGWRGGGATETQEGYNFKFIECSQTTLLYSIVIFHTRFTLNVTQIVYNLSWLLLNITNNQDAR